MENANGTGLELTIIQYWLVYKTLVDQSHLKIIYVALMPGYKNRFMAAKILTEPRFGGDQPWHCHLTPQL